MSRGPNPPTGVSLRWHTGRTGGLFLVCLVSAPVFGFAAVDPSVAGDMAEQRRGGFVMMGQAGEFNWIAAAIAVALVVMAIWKGWRWADRVAVRADDHGIRFHRSTMLEALPWAEVQAVSYSPTRRSGSFAVITTAGDLLTIEPIDPKTGPDFARAVTRRWLTLPPPPDGV